MSVKPAVWFFEHNINIFPIDRRDKSPVVPKGTSQFDYRCTRAEAETIGDYGVSLGMLAVADTDDPDAERWVQEHLPETPFTVTTARGRHRYYRLAGDAPHFIHRAGHTIEFRNKGQYVVGPGSVHKSGVVYAASEWSWQFEDIPVFPVADFQWDDRPLDQRGSTEGGGPFILPTVIQAGERHDLMFKLMRSLQARGVTDLSVLLKVLHVENLKKCSPPIAKEELEHYISRASRYKDREGFERSAQDGWTVAGGMLDTGLSIDAASLLVDMFEVPAEYEQPKQPSQPILENKDGVHLQETAAKIDTGPEKIDNPDPIVHLSKPVHSCIKCRHTWTQQRKNTPRRCPKCKSTLWNRSALVADADYIDPFDDDADADIHDPDTHEVVGRRKNGVITWDAIIERKVEEEAIDLEADDDCDIYDEETLEVVGHKKGRVITWYDK